MKERNALLAIHLGALLFGLSGIFGKLANTAPMIITFGRGLFAVIALALFAQLITRGKSPNPSLRQLAMLALGGLLLGAHWITFFHAVQVAGVAIATLGFASFPAFTLLLEGLLFRERIRVQEFLIVALVSLGLVLVTPSFDWGSAATLGLLSAILSGLLFSLLSLLNRVSVKGLDPVKAALCQNLTIVLCLAPFSWPLLHAVQPMDWFWIALLGVFCTGLAHSLFVASLKVLKARTTAVIFALEPVYGIAFAWWLFDEQPGLRMLAGGALIIFAIALSARKGAAVEAKPATA
ncbi:DMT family transporter [Pseudomonas sp. JS3066]|jgi:drug/metabolite transporter (DMT)-like permease|uniref:DMT family transporter n=1 Tax=unclassified Pseudomonas TaxID=196821 RepID=UPI000EA96DD1|nr:MULTISPECIES: DMT family transporter [unclassified Pseudomonas]AYF85947.1 DMT family transporter [Pseudomonas sp. DY-1]MDH4656293.1 DMT family transporter [Pseudomonas sp. BN606]MRK19615.1 DMT family transporter [Pseudomonas sp. JG-B]WVK91466.1 DMT family transporter [Pseudomonas sp. JS3066]